MKKNLLMFIMVILILLNTGCSRKTFENPTLGNMVNDGLVLKDENNFYYVDQTYDNKGLYKVDKNWSNKILLLRGDISYISINGDWIYYRNDSQNGSIYKIKTDGTNNTKITDSAGVFINVVNDEIFYKRVSSNIQEEGAVIERLGEKKKVSLSKIDIDGKVNEIIVKEDIYYVNVVDDWIYYVTDSDKIYKAKKDGTEKQELYEGTVSDLIVYQNKIYFKDFNKDELHMINLDGSDDTVLLKDKDYLGDYNVYEDYVYLSTGVLEGQLLKISLKDSSDIKVIADDSAESINIVDGYVYYINKDDNWRLYRIKVDGTERMGL